MMFLEILTLMKKTFSRSLSPFLFYLSSLLIVNKKLMGVFMLYAFNFSDYLVVREGKSLHIGKMPFYILRN